MRVLIVDDHPIARQGLATLVRDAFRVEKVVEADTPRDALVLAKKEAPALVLLDLRMPAVEQTSVLCTQLRVAAPRAKIAIITAFEEPDELRRCFAAGADACLLKDTPMLEFRQALQSVMAGHRVIDPRVAQTMAAEHILALRADTPTIALTQREREVLDLLAQGCSNRLIAERLFIAEATVKGHVSVLLDKLGAESRLQAVVCASELGLV